MARCFRYQPWARLLEIRSDDPEELLGSLGIQCVGVLLGVYKMRSDVLLNHFRHESSDGAAHAGDQMHDLFATGFILERTLDRLHLTADTADPRQESLFFMNGMCHVPVI
jgi:hypothetical protein